MIKLSLLIGGAISLHWLLGNWELIGRVLGIIWALVFPFILGLIIAFLINIPMQSIEKLLFKNHKPKVRRPISFLLTVLLVVFIITLIGTLVLPQLVATVASLANSMPGYLDSTKKSLEPLLAQVPLIQPFIDGLNLDWNSIGTKLFTVLQSGAGNVFNSTVGVASSIVNGTTSFIIGFIFSCYVLLDKEHLAAQLEGLMKAYLSEKKYKQITNLASLSNRIFSKFVSGQCIEAIAICLFFLIVLSIGRFDYPLLISVLIGFLSLIPIFGAFIGCAIGALLILVSSGLLRAVAFIVVFLVVQQIDGNFMYPRIVGTSIGLPPIWVLVAVTVGAGLMGIFGMLFFIPLTSVLYTLLYQNATARLKYKGIESPVSIIRNSSPPKKSKNKNK